MPITSSREAQRIISELCTEWPRDGSSPPLLAKVGQFVGLPQGADLSNLRDLLQATFEGLDNWGNLPWE